jgi:hypothetical protein
MGNSANRPDHAVQADQQVFVFAVVLLAEMDPLSPLVTHHLPDP